MNEQDYAIVVGINHYPGLRDSLAGAEADAVAFSEWLRREDGGGVPRRNIAHLVTSDFHPPWPDEAGDAQPNVPSFEKRFIKLVCDSRTHRALPTRRRLYLFLSGHGFAGKAEADEAALLAANVCAPAYPHLAATRYAMWARAAGVYREIVLLMDCCRDMSLTRPIRDPDFDPVQNPAAAPRVKMLAWYAPPLGAKAKEGPSEGGAVRGVFSRVLIDALDQADDGSGKATGEAVAKYIHNSWPTAAPGLEPPSLPLDPGRDIVFKTHKTAAGRRTVPVFTVAFALTAPAPGSTLLVTKDGVAVTSAEVGDATPVLALPLGLFKAELTGTGRTALFEVIGEGTPDVQI